MTFPHCVRRYVVFIAALQQEGVPQRLCLFAPLRIPPTAVQTCCYFLPPTCWMCALRDSSIPRNPAFSLLHFFMDSPFLFSVFFSPDSGQRDGCCVMSVIALILPFSQHFNLFMLLPNLYWAIICILYMITFPLPVVWQLWGSCWLVQYLLLLWRWLVNNNMKARPVRRTHVNKKIIQMFFFF